MDRCFFISASKWKGGFRKGSLHEYCFFFGKQDTGGIMKLKNILSEKLVLCPLKATSKQEVISELLNLLVVEGKVQDPSLALSDLLEREKKMTTGIQNGVAIPHAKTKAVESLTACIGIKREGLDFQSLDGKPSQIFILTLSPYDEMSVHVQFMAEISMVIKSEVLRDTMVNATSKSEILSVFGL
jgi:PTS system nitrogen regulatory IIA component